MVGNGLEKVWTSDNLNGKVIVDLENYEHILLAGIEGDMLQKDSRKTVSTIGRKIQRKQIKWRTYTGGDGNED